MFVALVANMRREVLHVLLVAVLSFITGGEAYPGGIEAAVLSFQPHYYILHNLLQSFSGILRPRSHQLVVVVRHLFAQDREMWCGMLMTAGSPHPMRGLWRERALHSLRYIYPVLSIHHVI